MIVSVDPYLNRPYRGESYNCLHFAAEVWRDLTGCDITGALAAIMEGPVSGRKFKRLMWAKFERLEGPRDPSLVLMRRAPERPHTGVYLRARCLHNTREGVLYQPLEIATLGFTEIRFYTCKP